MAKGASQRSGPPPDPNALHRERDGDTWTTLPKSGREGPIPEWPLEDEIESYRLIVENLEDMEPVPAAKLSKARIELVKAKRRAEREQFFWKHEWNRPQAIMWERNGQEREVAVYCRTFARAEKSDAPIQALTLLRQQMEALGVSIPGLMRNRWTIEDSKLGELRQMPSGKQKKGSSSRERFRVVESS